MSPGSQPLAGFRVVELGTGISSSYCCKMLADYGADVVKVEPPEGDPVRRYGPFPGDLPDPERSGLFLHLNTNKRSITLDLQDPAQINALKHLAAGSDALVENLPPGRLASLGLSYQELSALNGRTVMTSITPFGQDGPYRDWPATEMVLFAMSGRMFGHGHQERQPLRYAPDTVWFQAGATAAAATISALWGASLYGSGAWIDMSIQEAMAGNVDSRLVLASYSNHSGGRSYRATEYPRGAYPCKDGFVLFGAGTDRYFRRVCRAIGRPDLLEDPRWSTPEPRPAHRDEWEAAYLDWAVDRTRREIFEICQAEGVLCAPILTADEVLQDPQYLYRESFRPTSHPVAGDLILPGPPFRLSEAGWAIRRPAPQLGEHNPRDLSGTRPVTSSSHSPSRPAGPLTGPLRGIRIIDSSEVWAGPMGTSVLADLGAHVVKAESFPRAPQTRPVTPPTARYGFAADEPNPPRPWDRAGTHNMANRNKHGIALNARDPDGLRVFQRLACISDVLVDGYAAGVMERMGMGYDLLAKLNPGLIVISMAGWGSSGPYSGYVSLGSTIDAMVGHHFLRTYPDADPSQSPACVHSDAVGAMALVFATVCALFQRQHTGRGQWVDLSQAEAFLPHMAYPLLDSLMNGRVAQPLGNHDRFLAPHGCYPCRGEDNWVVICVETESQWLTLCALAGHPEWAADPRFTALPTRYANQDALDELVAAWTAPQDKHQLARRLAAAGVPSAPVLKELEVLDDEHLAARGFFQQLDHQVVGPRRYPGLLWRQTGVEPTVRTGPNALGEHNRVVLEEYLGCTVEECRTLEARSVVGDAYPRDAGLDSPNRRTTQTR